MTAAELAGVGPRQPVTVGSIAIGAFLSFLMAALPGWSGVSSVACLGIVAVFRVYPALGVAAVALTVPLQDMVRFDTVAGEYGMTRFVSLALLVAMIVSVPRGMKVTVDRIAVMHFLLLVTLLASFAAGISKMGLWRTELYQWGIALVIYVICRSLRMSLRQRTLIIAALCLGVIVTSVAGFSQFITGAGPESYQVNGFVRIFGTFHHPNSLAAFLGLTLPLLIALACVPSRMLPVHVAHCSRAGAGMGVAALVLTQSRGGWLAVGCAILFLLVMAPRSVQRIAAACAGTVALGAVAFGLATDIPGLSRFTSIVGVQSVPVQVTTETWGQFERQAHWGAAWSMLMENPLSGVGAGQFNEYFREHTPNWRFRIARGHAHNGYLHMAAQAGVPGILAYLGWLGTISIVLLQRLAYSIGVDRAIAVGAAGCMVAYIVHSVFEYLGVLSLPVILAIVVAVAIDDSQSRTSLPLQGSGPSRAGVPS